MKSRTVILLSVVIAGYLAAGARDVARKNPDAVVLSDSESTIPKPSTPQKPTEATEENAEQKPADPELQVDGALAVVLPLPAPPPDPDEQLVRELELTPSQLAAMQVEIDSERAKTRPLIEQLTLVERKLISVTLNGVFEEKEVRELAGEEARIMQELIVANVRLESKLYQMLTEPQRRKINKARAQSAISGTP